MKEIIFVDATEAESIKAVEAVEVVMIRVVDLSVVLHIEGGERIILNDDTIEAIRQEL